MSTDENDKVQYIPNFSSSDSSSSSSSEEEEEDTGLSYFIICHRS